MFRTHLFFFFMAAPHNTKLRRFAEIFRQECVAKP
jgi:hypothetical protein